MEIKRYIIGNFGTNVYLAYCNDTKEAFLVDPAEGFEKLKNDIIKLGLSLKYIVITHGHGDHTGGIDYFKEAFPGALLVVGKAEKKFIYDRDQSMGKGGYVADIYVKDGDELTVGDITLKFIDTPGHTPGGVSILCGDVVFSGDTLFQCSVGRTDFTGGSWDSLVKSIKEKLFVLPENTRVLPGHGGETEIGYEKRYNPFV